MMKQKLLKLMVLVLTLLGGVNVAMADDVTYSPTLDVNFRTASDNASWQTVNNAANDGKTDFELTYTAGFFSLQKYTVANLSTATKLVLTLTVGSKAGVDAVKLWAFTKNDWTASSSAADIVSLVSAQTGINPRATEGTANSPLVSGAKVANSDPAKATFTITGDALATIKANATSDGTFTLLLTNDNLTNTNNKRSYLSNNSSNAEANRPTLVATVSSSTSETYTDVITPKVDTYLRKGNTTDHGSETTMELKTYADGDADFVGYMSFDYSVPSGMELQSAKLRVVSAQIKGNRTLNFYSFAADVAGNAKYADYADAITAAKATTAVGTVSLEGQNNKSVVSDDITTEKYQTITAWQNTVDLTDFVKTQTGNFGLLLAREDANNSNKIFTSEATGISNSNCTYFNNCTASDLVPQLTLVFKKKDGSDPTPTSLLTKDNSKTVDNTTAHTEVYKVNNTSNTVTVTVIKTADQDGDAVAAHGTVTATAAKDANDKIIVTLTATPEDRKHEIDGTPVVEIVASDSDGDQGGLQLANRRAPEVGKFVDVTDNGNGTYTFEMPADNSVEVSAKFKKLADIPVVAPTITYDADNNKVTIAFGTEEDGYNQATKMYYTTDGTDPRSSATRTEITATTVIEVTAGMTTIQVVGVYESDFSDVVEQEVSRRSYLNVTKEWVAFYSPNTYSVPEGLKAYTIKSVTQPTEDGQSGTVTLQEQNVINKNTPMLIQNTTSGLATTKFQITAADDADLSSDMCSEYKGTATSTTLSAASGSTFYVLKNGVFLRVANPGAVSAYNCWLELGASAPTNAPRYIITIGANTTRIDTIGTATIEGDDAWYTLSGTRVAKPTQKGIYIHNGKKILVK